VILLLARCAAAHSLGPGSSLQVSRLPEPVVCDSSTARNLSSGDSEVSRRIQALFLL